MRANVNHERASQTFGSSRRQIRWLYFCANTDAIQRAATQVRERCELLHGMEFDSVVGTTRVLNKQGKWCNYAVGDYNYDLKCMCGRTVLPPNRLL
jgi:hypothetical protein